MNLDLAGICKLGFDLLGDVSREQNHLVFTDGLRLDHDTNLATGLNRIGTGNSREALGDLFQLLQTLDIILNVLTAGAGTGSGDRVGSLYEAGYCGVRLHVVVVGFNRVDDGIGLVVLPGNVDTDGNMASFDFMVDGLADIMQETGTLGGDHIDTQLRCQETGDVGNFDRVVQNVLAIAGAVTHASQQANQFGMQTVDIGLEHGAFAFGLNGGVDFLLGFGDHFFNAGGVNAAILDELLQRETGNLPAHRIETRDGDGFRRIVDNQITAG